MVIVYVGIDLAKNVFAVHGVDEHGQPALGWRTTNCTNWLRRCHPARLASKLAQGRTTGHGCLGIWATRCG